MDSGAGINGEVFDQRPLKRPRFHDAGRELPVPAPAAATASWADVQPDMLRVVLGFLPCFADRARVRSVCRDWRAVARSHGVPPPLPVLVLPKSRYAILSPDGAFTAERRVPLPEEVPADDVRWVGSFEGWLVGMLPSRYHNEGDGKCFLLNAFSHEVVHLPDPCAINVFKGSGSSTSTLPIINDSGKIYCTVTAREYVMSFDKVVLSAPPDSGSKCIVAALSWQKNLALWRHGMRSWCVCRGSYVIGTDLAFHQGKLYILWKNNSPCLFAFEIDEDDCGIMVSRVERCVTEPLPPVEHSGRCCCNMVEWRGKLLLIIRYFNGLEDARNVQEVKVFALDFSTNPYGLSEIHSLDGECVFVDSCNSRSFPVGLYDRIPGDRIYFVDEYIRDTHWSPSYDTFVYNMSDGTVAPFAAELSPDDFGAPGDHPAYPSWFFPPK